MCNIWDNCVIKIPLERGSQTNMSKEEDGKKDFFFENSLPPITRGGGMGYMLHCDKLD